MPGTGLPNQEFPALFFAKLTTATAVLQVARSCLLQSLSALTLFPCILQRWGNAASREVSGLTRTRPFLSLSLKTPQGKPQCGPRTIFRDNLPPPLAMLSQEPGLAKPPAEAVGDGERQSCQRGRRMPQLRFHIQSPRLHLSDLPAGKPSPLSSLKTTKLIIFLPAVPPTPTALPPTFPGQGAGEPSGSICWTPSTFAPWDGGGAI